MKTTESAYAMGGIGQQRKSRQLDFDLPELPPRRQRIARTCSQERAAWWFDLMRRVVDEGIDFPETGN